MYNILLLIFAIVASFSNFVICTEETADRYTDKYDHVDFNEILANNRLRTQYYKCAYGSGPCLTPDSVFMKSNYKN